MHFKSITLEGFYRETDLNTIYSERAGPSAFQRKFVGLLLDN